MSKWLIEKVFCTVLVAKSGTIFVNKRDSKNDKVSHFFKRLTMKKFKQKKRAGLLLLATSLFLNVATAQNSEPKPVGIGTTQPDQSAVLELKSTSKGILFPRLTTSQRGGISNPAIGLTIYNTENNCLESWNGTDWVGNCGVTKAVASVVSCGSVQVTGSFTQGAALSPVNNTLVLQLNVTKAGTYTIQASPTVANGYYFNQSGTFSSIGTVALTIPGLGTPNAPSTSTVKDTIMITINDAKASCKIPVDVASNVIPPAFHVNCSSITSAGFGVPGAALNSATNTMSVQISGGGIGSTYNISTNTVNGITFGPSQGTVVSDPQTITLAGSGTPTAAGPQTFTITSNGTGSPSSCSGASYTIAYPTLSIKGFSNGTYGYVAVNNSNALSGYMMASSANFGNASASTFPTQPVNIVQQTTNEGAGQVATLLNGTTKPDIVIIGYNMDLNSTDISAINTYLNNKGVVLWFNERGPSAGSIPNCISGMLGYTTGTLTAGAGQQAYACPMLTAAGDPVLNGPFGTLNSTNWIGEDGGGGNSINFGSVAADFTPYSSWDGGTSAHAFRHKTKNFIYVGDGGFLAGQASDAGCTNDATRCPCTVSGAPAYTPTQKTSSKPGGGTVLADNSKLFANMMAWAIKTAATNGINPH
jgi:hypothetical protein